MKKSFFLLSVLLSVLLFSQKQSVGIGNNNPRGLLDVNDNPSGNATGGLVLPTVSDVLTFSSTNVLGTIVYDTTNDCIKYFRNTGVWSNCIIEK